MNQFVFANNIQTTLAAPVSSATQVVIEVSSTANLPASIPVGYYLALTLNDAATQTFFEIVYVTDINGANLTVLRGQENTTARTWNTNDLAYSAATAGVLASFLSLAQSGEFVELSPGSAQTGFIDITGGVTAGGAGNFGGGVSVGGALSNASSGSFSGDVTALDLITSKGYANTALASLPLRFNGSASVVGVGPSSGIAVNGITASVLAIGAVSSGKCVAIDVFGNLSAYNNLYAGDFVYANAVSANDIYQGANHVLDTITSPANTITVDKTGGLVTIDIANSGALIGSSVGVVDTGPTFGSHDVTITLPGTSADVFIVALRWYFSGIGGVISASVFLANGSMTTSYTNGPLNSGSTGEQAGNVICMIGKAAGGQTLKFTTDISSGSTTESNPIEIVATRIS